ncbi:MAG: hypothetical protein BMS9Abin37_0534 [Acidobacteriota bacterium]|nr:MAG: hypothetical protein BMS9Abin37_0534 [Acidobacteriota bacterium]
MDLARLEREHRDHPLVPSFHFGIAGREDDRISIEKLPAVMLLQPIERRDVRVIELRKKPGFSLEPIQAFFVSCELLGKDFDGDVASEFRVPCPIDLAHASHAQRREDFVDT